MVADPECTAQIEGVDGLVLVDRNVTEALEAEGWAADLIRGLQDARKQSGFEVSDRITVTVSVPADKVAWAQRHQDYIAGEVLATSFAITDESIAGLDIIEGVTATLAKVAAE